MKRKLWWILLAAVLLAALWCGPAAASGHLFTVQPQSGRVNPETRQFTVSWETNFVPVKVEIVRIEYEDDTVMAL